MEKRTKVKARVISHAIAELIQESKCEKYEQDNDLWRTMYRDKDKQILELTISKKQENALTLKKRKGFWNRSKY